LVVASNKHIVILCSRLDLPGGIERAIVNLANLFGSKGHQVSLFILDETSNCFYSLSNRVKIVRQPLSFGISREGNLITRKIKFAGDIFRLKKLLKQSKPDIVIATEYPFAIAARLAGMPGRSKLVSWEHHHFNWIKKNRFWRFLQNRVYPRLDAVVCLNNSEAKHFSKFSKTYTIPNSIENKSGLRSDTAAKTILSVGWLIPRKGIDYIMQIALIVLKKYPEWKWKLIGDGEMKNEVLQFIFKEKLEQRFILQAVTADVENDYLNASMFVLASRFEAFPMVLLEAMSCGLPCISFDCPSGPSEIITTNEDGILVENGSVEKLTEAISALIADEVLRKKMGEKAFENIQRFSPENIYKLWQELL
jgi:glycosyltransferase involved in cell wall biosynthesis